jgi:acetyl/propionyl-CoA carboxylase alpha subunit
VAIRKLLVANRGEIAARIFRTCDRLGIATVAVEAPDDRGAFHTRRAGEVMDVLSYLFSEEMIRAARRARADAIHPGYGFLSESAEFAEAVEAAGLVWVGPPPDAMRVAASKLEAKELAAKAGVPTLPSGEPSEVGYPLILKAAAGGGGRGMRVVREAADLEPALEAARREAQAAFRDGTVFAERLVEGARHVEVQLLGDTHGAVRHAGARDCSIQRRHQKILEETPPPGLEPVVLGRICAAAAELGRLAGYENAGTAEFLVVEDRFWFIELNARLQVEHPVTELVTGLDLVEEQLRIAAGEPLAAARDPDGYAVEARLYAEDPVAFLPQPGVVERLELPETVRVDAGIEAGDHIPVSYDPLVAKLVAYGETRNEVLAMLGAALRATRVGGVTTNLGLLRWLVLHPTVRAGEATTSFLAEHPPFSLSRPAPRPWRAAWRLNADAPPSQPPPAPERAFRPSAGDVERSEIRAPMPGTVVRVLVSEGELVTERQPLVVLEAMKMETPIVSPHAAVVRRLAAHEGDHVPAGALLAELEE